MSASFLKFDWKREGIRSDDLKVLAARGRNAVAMPGADRRRFDLAELRDASSAAKAGNHSGVGVNGFGFVHVGKIRTR